MRKVVVSMNVTLDGFMSGPNCELNWHFERWTSDMGIRLSRELSDSDTILLGRTTYSAMSRYWPSRESAVDCSGEDLAFAVMMNNHHKVVYSNTLEHLSWNNSTLITGDLEQEVLRLKLHSACNKKNIIVYGSGKLVAALLRCYLIDELQLWIHPVLLGRGKHLFTCDYDAHSLRLTTTEVFKSGVVLLQYASTQVSKSNYQLENMSCYRD